MVELIGYFIEQMEYGNIIKFKVTHIFEMRLTFLKHPIEIHNFIFRRILHFKEQE